MSATAFAQFTDSFTDGNFTADPVWTGDVNEFTINPALQLESRADSILSGSNRQIYLSTPSTIMIDAQWEFFVNPRMATSSNNFFDVFLSSDQELLTGSNRGYFVRIGGTPDEVALFRKDGAGLQSYVINGVQGSIASSSNNPTRVKVTRSAVGLWTLLADYSGTGNNYELIGETEDNTYTTSEWFGVLVRYSNANRTRFIADDFYVGPIIIDDVPPILETVKPLTANKLELRFSEPVDPSTSQNPQNYVVNFGIGQAFQAQRSSSDFALVTIDFPGSFTEGQTYTINVSAVRDIAGNAMVLTQIQFVFYRPKAYDVIITELMPDPDPVVQLPSAEYIELYNRTEFPIDLQNWSVQASASRRILPAYTLLPDSFVVITNAVGAAGMPPGIGVIELASFPALTNSGATVILFGPDSTIIHAITYADTWYNNSAKAEGGWSLEMKSLLRFCERATNWSASENPSGGTPGRINSIISNDADEVSPKIERVVVLAPDTIRVFFTESIQLSSQLNPENYAVDNGIGAATSVTPFPPDFRSVRLSLANPLLQGQRYNLAIANQLLDCAGNAFNSSVLGRVAIPELVVPGDIVVNEILSNPPTEGNDFIEIYNRSQKVLELSTLQLSNLEISTDVLLSPRPLTTEGYLMFPEEYLVLTQTKVKVTDFYNTQNPDAFLEMASFPSFNNDEGVVVLSRLSDGTRIDQVTYNVDQHFPTLNTTKAVTLERINPDKASNDVSNWNSASAASGYGTPTYRNSQFAPLVATQTGEITVLPEVFSPDNDGFNDVVDIGYAFDVAGFAGDITVFDSNGRIIKYIARNQIFGTSGSYFWNGTNEVGDRSRTGIYIIILDAYNSNGDVVKLKKTCVLASRL